MRSGYRFTYVPGRPGALGFDAYSVQADPITPGVTGIEHYYVDNMGGIRHNSTRPAGPKDEPVP